MKLQISIVSFLSLSASASSLASNFCGSSSPPQEALEAAQSVDMGKRDISIEDGSSKHRQQKKGLVISTYLHVIESKKKAGTVTDKMINDQMEVLNETYHPHNIQFILKNVTRTINDEWADSYGTREKGLALRQGRYDDLNIFFESGLMAGDKSTGICSFPVKDTVKTGEDGTPWAILDGCHVNPGTMPGGAGQVWNPKDNKGKLATHEVGHWLGLFHVFSGQNCTGEGDLVDDTPAQWEVTNGGCPIGKNSCPDQPGLDSIHNYMDYADQDCQTEFTPGQEERMYHSFNTLRKGRGFDIHKLGPI
ncbi:hypothetical protein NW768_010260 [Fusarium equiseti]|uniref:Peptidase M43 pregnancy-associated plasma-A domain-containing protein n=1 Tax=Fusarium equiseti TaxID=61235 RepID=A0ABQ8R1B1_FUSEQ|nr:hypothetical protein NW768_010260 [Fusarium equiseti]